MWVAIAVSPILLLLIFSPTIKDKLGGGVGDIADKFVKNALAPIPVALALTVGFIMLKAVQNSFQTYVGDVGMSPVLSIPVTGMSTPQDLIVMIGTIAVIWMGVFSAAEGTLAEGITGKIKDGVGDFAKGLATMPIKHMPTGLKTADGDDIKAGHLPSILSKSSEAMNAPMRGLADKIFGSPAVNNSRIDALDPSKPAGYRSALRDMVANNQWTKLSKTDRNLLHTKLSNLSDTEQNRLGVKPLIAALNSTNRTETNKLTDKQKGALNKAGKEVESKVGSSKNNSPGNILGGNRDRGGRTPERPTTTPPTPIRAPRDNTARKYHSSASGSSPGALPDEVVASARKDAEYTSLLNQDDQTKIVRHIKTQLSVQHNGATYTPTADEIKSRIGETAFNELLNRGGFTNASELDDAIKAN